MPRILLLTLAIAAAAAGVAAATAATGSGTVVKTAYNADLKTTILVTSSGLTLYEYVGDVAKNQQPYPACVNDSTYHCIKLWPALLTTGTPHAGTGAKQSLIGTVKRSDNGKLQVTYAGHPLYRYAGGVSGPPDKKPGDVYGQGAVSIWYVLSPSGKVIKKPR